MANAFQKLGRYLIMREIAKGGMATIYQAKLVGIEGFEKNVAIKKILPFWSHQQEFIDMLIDEAKILVHLQHNNIVQIFELAKEKETYFIVMEFVNGFDLRSLTNKLKSCEQQIPLNLVCFIIKEICKGLDFAHTRQTADNRNLNIVHRDISPQNILVSREGCVKITDFGIAKIMGKSAETAAGALKGKFSYMSPEQALGNEVNHLTDIFALGALFYELLFLKKCFDGRNDLSIIEKVKCSQVNFPHNINESVKEILIKALSKDIANRFQSARDMLHAIKAVEKKLKLHADHDDLREFLTANFSHEIHTNVLRESSFNEKTSLYTQSKVLKEIPKTITRSLTIIEPDTIIDNSIISNLSIMTTNSLATNAKQKTRPQALQQHDPINIVYQRQNNLPIRHDIVTRLKQSWLIAKKTSLVPRTHSLFIAFFLCYLSLMSMNIMIYASPRHEPLTVTPQDIKPLAAYFPQWPRQAGDIALESNRNNPFDDKALARSKSLNLIETITKPLSYGLVKITARPWGQARMSNGKSGATPTTFRVPTGKQTITVTYPPNNKSVRKSIVVSKNALTHCKAAFNQKSGYMICK
ncbi:MAG: serine/threonine-protein kinase [bacterium]|nr:serine/threonine protein kinase [bacterium]MBU1918308.1 serine/threonine protein kinase [bacterium]